VDFLADRFSHAYAWTADNRGPDGTPSTSAPTPSTAREAYLINVRCLDDDDLAAAAPKIVRFDGENWEESFEALER
jgi:hypothetical protein